MEDWQSEKCDVTLLEGVPVNHVLSHLEEAAAWTRSISRGALIIASLAAKLNGNVQRSCLVAMRCWRESPSVESVFCIFLLLNRF